MNTEIIMSLLKRLHREYAEITENALSNCSAGPISEDDMTRWHASIIGPEETPYAGGLFRLEIVFPAEYPFKPPKVTFQTKIYHPNIAPNGTICLDILKSRWSPIMTVTKLLLSISSLLSEPNPDDPLVADIAALYKANYELFKTRAREWTVQFAG